jgi:hypothetical protein
MKLCKPFNQSKCPPREEGGKEEGGACGEKKKACISFIYFNNPPSLPLSPAR